MKNLALIFVIIIGFFFTNCQKENSSEMLSVDTEAIRAQLLATPVPTKEEIQLVLAEKSLKSATIEDDQPVLVQIFPLDARTYEVYQDFAIKYLIYYEINSDGYRVKYLTIRQEYTITNGIIDNYSSNISLEVNCQFGKYFGLRNMNDINKITYFFRFDNGKQFAYYGNGTREIKLPPIAGGKWQLDVVYYDGDLSQQFSTYLFDYYSDQYILELNIQIKQSNVYATLEMNKSFLDGAYIMQVIGENKNGDFIYMSYPLLFTGELKETVSFDLPFEIQRINICGTNGCYSYSEQNWRLVVSIPSGKKTYQMKN